jgi:two-component system, cell cycle sensor histidine kinase and response regulator CckA
MTAKPSYEELERRVQALEQLVSEQSHSKKALPESERLFKMLYEKAPLGYQSLDESGHFIVVNQTWLDTLGYTREEVIGKSFADFLHPDWRDHFKENFPRFKAIGEILGVEFEMVKKNGDFILVAFNGKIGRDQDGNFLQTHCMLDDVTERRRVEEALKKSEERFNLAMDASRDGVYEWDLETREIYYSPGWKRMLGYEPDEFPDDFSIWEKLTRPEDVEKSWQMMNELIEGKRDRFEMEFQMQHKDGHWIHILSRSNIYKDAKGEGARVVGTHVDVTDSIHLRERLRLSESRYKKAQELGKVGNWEYNLNTGLFWGSDEAKRIYGFDSEQDTFSKEAVESCIPEREKVHQALIDLIEKGTEYNLEFQIFPVNSIQPKTIISLAELLKNDKGLPMTVYGVVQDITERKQAEEEREKLKNQLSQAQKMESVGRLAGGIAHDFNNMLGIILGHTEMALDDVDPEAPLHASLQAIHQAAERSADLTRQLLAFARKQTIAPKVININETVSRMLNMLRRLIGEDIDLLWQPEANLPPVKVDPSQIDQLLANLCVNARDAIEGVGKITIETASVTFDEAYCAVHHGFVPGKFTLLAVSDDGCGMDKKTLNQIFEPFFTTKEQGKGTGLGLASVFGMVKQNKGFINVYSEPGQGTTFKIYLPAYEVKSGRMAEKLPELPLEGGNQTILLVEDEPAILEMTRMMLTRLGYSVVPASTPGEAIRLALEYRGKIDIMMTDVVMPEMNGRDLAGNLLAHYPDLKRLFMSGYTANVIAHHGVLDEGVHFIQKPFSMKDLGRKLREVLEG